MSGLHSIARALGGEVVSGQILAPGPGHGPLDRSLSVKLSATSPDGFVCHSFSGDDWRECRAHVRERLGLARNDRRRERSPRRTVKVADDARGSERDLASARGIKSEIVPLINTDGEAFLRDVRKIDVAVLEDVLLRSDAIGWHHAAYFNEPGHPLDAQRLGCIVAIMTDPVTAEPTGAISRTYLAPDGTKVGKAKTLGQPTGIVRLSRDDEVLEGAFLAEGLESALSGMAIGLRPMWSTGSASMIARFPLLNGVEALNVIVDHDASGAGERAAREVEARWLAAEREVNLLRSDTLGDLNDALRGGAR